MFGTDESFAERIEVSRYGSVCTGPRRSRVTSLLTKSLDLLVVPALMMMMMMQKRDE